jgi:nicotinate-nucleotide--dimethylbenzimidazole phosphoribosyltransferase
MKPKVDKRAVIVMASDHGVFDEGVAVSPRAVTMVQAVNMTKGLTGVCALSKAAGAEVVVVDVGIDADMSGTAVVNKKIMQHGSHNLAKGPALGHENAVRVLEAGIEVAHGKIDEGATVIGIGEMGIANTTPSSAIVSVITGTDPKIVTGPGANLPKDKLHHKAEVIRKSIELNKPNPKDGVDILAKVGGLDIGGMAGVILGCASRNVPVIIDGFIALAAATLAATIKPEVKGYLIPSHRSMEPGAKVASEYLQLDPPLAMDMRLGEGTGAALMFGILNAAVHMESEMVSFSEGGFTLPPAEK